MKNKASVENIIIIETQETKNEIYRVIYDIYIYIFFRGIIYQRTKGV